MVGCLGNKRARFILLITLLGFAAPAILAQAGPRSVSEIQESLLPLERISRWQSPAVDVAALRVDVTLELVQ